MLKTPRISLFNFDYPKVIIWVVTFGLLSGCTTFIAGPRIENVNRPMVTLLRAVEYASPGGVLRRGPNNRSFFSNYHPPGGNPNKDARRKNKRAQSVIHLVNSRRPYTIIVEYRVEEKFGDSYQLVEKDQEEAQKIKDKLQDYLDKKPAEGNMIDNFQAF